MKRHRTDGGVWWDATVRVRGYVTQCRSLARGWRRTPGRRAHTEAAAAAGRATLLALALRHAALARHTSALLARHSELLTGPRAHGHKTTKPGSASTVRTYLAS